MEWLGDRHLPSALVQEPLPRVGWTCLCLSSRAAQLLQLLLILPFVDRNYWESLYALIHVHRALNVTCFHRGTVSIQV